MARRLHRVSRLSFNLNQTATLLATKESLKQEDIEHLEAKHLHLTQQLARAESRIKPPDPKQKARLTAKQRFRIKAKALAKQVRANEKRKKAQTNIP